MMLCHSRIDSALYIYNNVVWQQGGVKGISVEYQEGDPVDVYLYNNTVVLDNPANVMYPVGFWPSRVHSKNNILYSVTSIYDFATSTPTELTDINYNIYRNTSSNEVVAFNGNGYSWNNWKSMAGSPDSHSYHSTANNYPDFTDMTNGDFTIQPGSPAAGSGTNLQNEIQGWGIEGVEWKDINGVPRGSSPSMGAYEIQGGGGGGNNLPSQPESPAPANGALNQNTNSTLSWSCTDPDGDPLTYDVYFGTTNNPPLAGSNQTNTNYNPGQLDKNTTYYWKIVAKDNQGGVTEGSVWSFITGELSDTTQPELVYTALSGPNKVIVDFSEIMDPITLSNKNNYSINNGVTVESVTVLDSKKRVILTTTDQSFGSWFTLTVKNVKDIAGNLINPNERTFTYHATKKYKYPVIDASGQWYQNFTPQKAIDGNPDTTSDSRWGGVVNLPDSIIFDLGQEVT